VRELSFSSDTPPVVEQNNPSIAQHRTPTNRRSQERIAWSASVPKVRLAVGVKLVGTLTMLDNKFSGDIHATEHPSRR
jgi:hypothetical protein